MNKRTQKRKRIAKVEITSPKHSTFMDADGAVRSVQTARLLMPPTLLDSIWSPEYMDRLARTYWRFLSRISLGLIRVTYGDRERCVVLLTKPFVLIRFLVPEYELSGTRGVVRWRIERGLLVSKRGYGGKGHLEIEVDRRRSGDQVEAHVKVEVANFYPAIASGISTWLYKLTQGKIHVIVTHSFLRSLARLDLAEPREHRLG